MRVFKMCASFLHYGRLLVLLAAVGPLLPAQQLLHSTYLGGSNADSTRAMVSDAAGNLYITGQTYSADFPVTPGALQPKHGGVPGNNLDIGDTHASDIFIAKLNADATTVLWATYLGGTGNDIPYGIAVDAAGNVYVAGSTTSPNFPVTAGAFQTQADFQLHPVHGFVTKIDPTGHKLIWSTLLAGNGIDIVNGIAVDASGNVFVTGGTSSANFPTTPGAWQSKLPDNPLGIYRYGFVTKLAPDGSKLLYSTGLGGSIGAEPSAIALDSTGAAIVVGSTASVDFPTTPGAYQSNASDLQTGFAARVHPAGVALTWSTYLPMSATAVAVATDGSMNIGGQNSVLRLGSDGSYLYIGGQNSVLRLGADGSYRYLARHGNASIAALAIDAAGTAHVAGFTASTPFAAAPCYSVVRSPFQNSTVTTGCLDAFLMELDTNGNERSFLTFGGNDTDTATSIALDAAGNVAIAGSTGSLNLPITAGAPMPTKSATICSYAGSPTSYIATVCDTPFIAKFGAAQTTDLRVVHGGSRQPGAVAPGEMVRLLHSSLIKDDQAVVQFDEFSVVAAQSIVGEVMVRVPDGVSGRKQVTVRFQGLSAKADLGPLVPSLFMLDATHAAVNADGTVNDTAHPAPVGSVLAVYGTGITADVQVWVAGLPAHVEYVGPAPGMPDGIQQVNFREPAGSDIYTSDMYLFLTTGATLVSTQPAMLSVGKGR